MQQIGIARRQGEGLALHLFRFAQIRSGQGAADVAVRQVGERVPQIGQGFGKLGRSASARR